MLTLDKTAWFQPTQACLPACPEVNMLAQEVQEPSGHPEASSYLQWCGQATQTGKSPINLTWHVLSYPPCLSRQGQPLLLFLFCNTLVN